MISGIEDGRDHGCGSLWSLFVVVVMNDVTASCAWLVEGLEIEAGSSRRERGSVRVGMWGVSAVRVVAMWLGCYD